MKRDIQICYNEIEIICNSLNSFKTALEEIKASMKKFDGYIQMNSGKTINELIDKNSIINDELNTCEEEVKDLYDIFKGYIEATSYYIKAVNPSAMMRVDRNDIWWNLFSVSSIKASCDNLAFLKYRQYSTTSAPFYLDEEERDRENRRLRHNYNEMEEYRGKFCRAYENIQDELDELERIYKNKIIEFENADDHYASKASELYDKYSSRGEKIWDFVEGAGKAIYDLLDGALTAVDDLVTGIINLIGGLVIFTAADLVYLATLPFGVTPKWASDCVTEVDTTVKAILKDPVLIVEGMAQEGSDAVEEKGIAFGIGFVGGSIAADILVSKGIGKLKALNKMDDAAKIASKTDEAGNIAKNANILSGSADDVAEAGAKAGAVGGGLKSSFAKNIDDVLTKQGITLDEFNSLRLKDVSTLTDAEKATMKAIRESVPMPDADTLMQKVIPADDIGKYMDGSYTKVGGYVAKAEDVAHLGTYDELYESLRLDYPGSVYKPMADDSIGVIRYTTDEASKVSIPYGKEMGGTVTEAAPFTGNGFTKATNGEIIPEFKCDGFLEVADGAQLIEISENGTETIKAVYSKIDKKFIPVK